MTEPSAYHCFANCFSSCWRKKRTITRGADSGQDHQCRLIHTKEGNVDELETPKVITTPVGNGCCVLGGGHNTSYAYMHVPPQNGDIHTDKDYSIAVDSTKNHNPVNGKVHTPDVKGNKEKTCQLDKNMHAVLSNGNVMNCNADQYFLSGDFDTSISQVKAERDVEPSITPVPTGAKCEQSSNRNARTVNGSSSLDDKSEVAATLLSSSVSSTSVSSNTKNGQVVTDAGISAKDILIIDKDEKPKETINSCSSMKKDGNNIQYFRCMIETESDRLCSLIQNWEGILVKNSGINEEVRDEIRSVNGQTRLVISERFTQFSSLVNIAEKHLNQDDRDASEKTVTLSDLQGFWDMIYFQVEDVVNKFQRLDQAKEYGWNLEVTVRSNEMQPRKRSANSGKAPRKAVTKKTGVNKPVSEEEKARKQAARKRIAEARKRLAAQNAQKEENDGDVIQM